MSAPRELDWRSGLSSEVVLVVCDEQDARATTVRAYLAQRGWEQARWFAARDVDEADDLVRGGSVCAVVFPAAGDALRALWDRTADLDGWSKRGVRIELVDSPSAPDAALTDVVAQWAAWRHRTRRRQVIAGVILSLVAIGATFGLLYVA